jgi:hypothetical protein
MGSKRGVEKIERLKAKLYAGMAMHGITEEVADEIYARIQAFASFGFAESHAISFALLVYASSWLKLHYPGAFLADAYAIDLPPGVTRDALALARFTLERQAPWVDRLMTVRDCIVSLFGLKTARALRADGGPAGTPRVGIFRIYETLPDEVVLGEDDTHLDFRLSVHRSADQLTAVTVVHCPEEMSDVRLAIGSNAASVWWVNGQEVINIYGDRQTVIDDGVSKRLTLKKGANVVRSVVVNGGFKQFYEGSLPLSELVSALRALKLNALANTALSSAAQFPDAALADNPVARREHLATVNTEKQDYAFFRVSSAELLDAIAAFWKGARK